MASRTVIVTGGMGFIGQHTIEPLISRGFAVHIVTRSIDPTQREAIVGRHSQAVRFHQVDLHDTEKVTPLVKKIRATHLLHLAWDTRHGIFWNSPENLDWIVTSKLLLIAFIEAGGKRAVGAGTCAEYDWEGQDPLQTEGASKLLPMTMYGQSKLAFRKSMISLGQHHNISTAWGRVFLFFGPHEGPKRFVASVIKSLLQGREFVASAGDQIRDFSDVRDVAAGFVALLDSQVTGDVNIASGEARSVASVMMQIGEILGRCELIKLGARPKQPGEPARLVAAVERLRKDVKWKPGSSFDQRLRETIEWWREQELSR